MSIEDLGYQALSRKDQAVALVVVSVEQSLTLFSLAGSLARPSSAGRPPANALDGRKRANGSRQREGKGRVSHGGHRVAHRGQGVGWKRSAVDNTPRCDSFRPGSPLDLTPGPRLARRHVIRELRPPGEWVSVKLDDRKP